MNQVQLSAGSLAVNVSTDENTDLDVAVQAAHNEMKWMMDAWTKVEGEMVTTHPQGFHMGDD